MIFFSPGWCFSPKLHRRGVIFHSAHPAENAGLPVQVKLLTIPPRSLEKAFSPSHDGADTSPCFHRTHPALNPAQIKCITPLNIRGQVLRQTGRPDVHCWEITWWWHCLMTVPPPFLLHERHLDVVATIAGAVLLLEFFMDSVDAIGIKRLT